MRSSLECLPTEFRLLGGIVCRVRKSRSNTANSVISSICRLPLDFAQTMFFHVGSSAVAVAVIAILLVLNVVAVSARVFTRRSLKQQMKADDWLILPALVSRKPLWRKNNYSHHSFPQALTIGMAASIFIGIREGFLFNQSPDMIPKGRGPLSAKLSNAFTHSKEVCT